MRKFRIVKHLKPFALVVLESRTTPLSHKIAKGQKLKWCIPIWYHKPAYNPIVKIIARKVKTSRWNTKWANNT